MKSIKLKLTFFGLFAVIGMVLFVVNLMSGAPDGYVTGFAAAILAVAVLKIIQYGRIASHEPSLKKFEINQQEERLIMIAEKSGRFTLLLTVFAELTAAVICMFLRADQFARIAATAAGLQTAVYAGVYMWLSKRL